MTSPEILADAVDRSRDWTLKLIADIEGDQWHFQPVPGGPHVLWLCGHLAFAEHLLILTRCLSGDPPDPEFGRHFPIGENVKSAAEHDYPSSEMILESMSETHAKVVDEVRRMTDEQLSAPCYGKDGVVHPHYATVAGAIEHCVRHEGFHAGQIAMLRRMMGKKFLR